MSHHPGAPPQPGPVPPAGQLRRRPKFWIVVGVVWLVTFGCSAALVGGTEDTSGDSKADTKAEARPGPTVTETVTPKPTGKPKPEPTATVTETERATKEVKVEVTTTVTAPPDGSGGAGADEETSGGDGPVHYENCDAARAAGAAPVRQGEPGYASHLDRDGDGVGCD
ncbi:excalibur calcium-binding domain-containing protein [Streptomyces sp. N2-109]|uniref:Excalibur calcium-binding domain-containing protein n=1 Tax=Streptomyces gossypii TaxID=2883101 RepID=A0ABT2K0M1_9ACTN|nr:excalibur calcium-binding domain-containing protein [Streptomyces gossypii]MCT2593179.1 excalibur calcium-binding domain-containing protein [Streptomyces gossypii]